MTRLILIFASAALLLAAGCKPKTKVITSLERKEAANLVSEARFAITLRDYARAEGLLAQAAQLCPDTGDYWLNLGMTRRRLKDTPGTKAAYQSALKAYREASVKTPKDAEPMLRQVYVLALLGKADEAKALLEQVKKTQGDDAEVKAFVDSRQLEQILADPKFKEIAL
jgi:tetratricopeptide (TPR) repeat protein